MLVEINRKLVKRHMVDSGNQIFDQDGKFRKEIVPKLVGQLIQESFVTGILYVNLTTEDELLDEIYESEGELYGFVFRRKILFCRVKEKINFDKLSKQVSKVLDIFQRLDEIDFNSIQSDFGETNKVIRGFLTQILETIQDWT